MKHFVILILSVFGTMMLNACASSENVDEDANGTACENGTFSCDNNTVMRCDQEIWAKYDECTFKHQDCVVLAGKAQCAKRTLLDSEDSSTTDDSDSISDSFGGTDSHPDSTDADTTSESESTGDSDSSTDTTVDSESESAMDSDSTSDIDTSSEEDTSADSESGSDADSDSNSDSGSDTETDSDTFPPTDCGNGILDTGEVCDDHNNESNDGCSADCTSVESGYYCSPIGAPCHIMAVCGDGTVVLPEACDDGNTQNGDGCNSYCRVEVGFKCDILNPSTCTATTCGDDSIEGSEECDDGNIVNGDGCTSTCQLEPNCEGTTCESLCGDGLVADGEACDDGNPFSGDGCSNECKVEDGYDCSTPCMDDENCTLKMIVDYRDFTASHSDFGGACDGLALGMVEPMLVNDKPVSTGEGCEISNFSDWYNTPVNKHGTILLYPNGSGAFANRYGENGEPWSAYPDWTWCANASNMCDECNCDANEECVNAEALGLGLEGFTACAARVEYDGTPLFFPVDDLNTDMERAKLPEQYGYNGWPWEEQVIEGAGLHNYYFTSEMTLWFQYDATAIATLQFMGDDDVWAFVNGQLAVDLGGVHVPESGSVTISAQNNFGMVNGGIYAVRLFHAERKMFGSSFRLNINGFQSVPSTCTPRCGDGIVGIGEQCDDVANDGGYGECEFNCLLGEYCGDGILQSEYEDCDPGIDVSCPNSCRWSVQPSH